MEPKEGTVFTNYVELICPYCNAHTTVNIGDLSDITQPDIEEVNCSKCKKTYLAPGTMEARSFD